MFSLLDKNASNFFLLKKIFNVISMISPLTFIKESIAKEKEREYSSSLLNILIHGINEGALNFYFS